MNDVDVLLPVRRPSPWLGEALASLDAQTLVAWRGVLVVHGGFEELPHLLAGREERWKVVRANDSSRLAQVLNAGLESCSAEFVARMDSDDVCHPRRLELQVSRLLEEPKVALIGTSAELIDEGGELIGQRGTERSPKELRSFMRWRNALIHPSVMFRRSVVQGLGGYNEHANGVEDYELWLRIMRDADACCMGESLLRYRLHEGQVSYRPEIPRAARKSVSEARLIMARAHQESGSAARARQAVWTTRQLARPFIEGLSNSVRRAQVISEEDTPEDSR